MQSLNIILTRHYIYYKSPDLSLEETILEVNQSDPDLLAHFSELVSALNLPRNTILNLILDHTYISFFYFHLPPVNRRKLDKILQYELADVLIDDIEEYFYDYHFSNIKEIETQIGIYLIKKEVVNQLVQICKTSGLEIRSILSLDDLLDSKMRDRYAPGNEIIIAADHYNASMFVYKNGFLIGSTNQTVSYNHEALSGQEPVKGIEALNWQIKAVGLKDNEIESVRISDEARSYLMLTTQNELTTNPRDRNGVPSTLCSDLFPSAQLGRSKQINLLKSNFFILQEARKHIKKIGFFLVFFGFACLLYISSIIYQNLNNQERQQELEKVYADVVNTYLPKGTQTANALQILNEQVNQLKAQRIENQKFVTREYKISSQLAELSKIKQQIPSLTLTKFLYTEQSIRIQGEIATFAEYDRLKNSLQAIYPKEYSLRYNQKSSGDEKIEFTVTIRPN